MQTSYRKALACIHDSGFLKYCEAAAGVVAEAFSIQGIKNGRIVDLGCGSGRLAELLTGHGHRVLGIDLSPDMIDLARRRCPRAEFRVGSYLDLEFPKCHAVTAIGECFNYLFDKRNQWHPLVNLFQTAYDRLCAGGFFLFDIATPGRLGNLTSRQQIFETDEWTIFVDSNEDDEMLTRRIISFSREDMGYKKDVETHHLRLMNESQVLDSLKNIGFEVSKNTCYQDLELPSGMVCFTARKPSA